MGTVAPLKPYSVRTVYSGRLPTFVLFYERKPERSRKRHGKEEHSGEDTRVASKDFGYMTEFCGGNRDTGSFLPIPDGMRQPGRYVTGRVDRGACGFTFDYLQPVRPELGFNPKEWTSVYRKSSQAGVWCATKCEPDEVRTWYVVAVARLCKPYAVWFRGERGIPPVG